MRKWLLKLGSLVMVVSLLFGCSNTGDEATPSQNTQPEANEEQINNESEEDVVTITISVDRGEEIVAEKEVPVEAGSILMDVLKENFTIEEEGGFIQAIEGISQDADEGKYWLYFVNDEEATVGAHEYELLPGDRITFDLQSWE